MTLSHKISKPVHLINAQNNVFSRKHTFVYITSLEVRSDVMTLKHSSVPGFTGKRGVMLSKKRSVHFILFFCLNATLILFIYLFFVVVSQSLLWVTGVGGLIIIAAIIMLFN